MENTEPRNTPNVDPEVSSWQPPQRGMLAEEEAPRYATLRDYGRVIRRRWWIIAAVAIAFAGVAFLYFSVRSPQYEARARFAVNAIPADGLPHVALVMPTNPTQQAVVYGELARSPEVARRAKRILKTDVPPSELQEDVQLKPAEQAGIGLVAADSTDAEFAADLANAYARALRSAAAEEVRSRLERAQELIATETQTEEEQLPPNVPAAANPRLAQLQQEDARVEAIKGIAEPVEISERADVPEAPSGLVPAVYTVVAGVIGLIFGTLAAFGRESLDRRLRTAQEVQEELDLPVLARVSETVLGRAGLAKNGFPPVPGREFEPFRALRLNLGHLAAEESPRSVLVTSGLPEEGKSTVSMSLASAAVLTGQRTLLVECDFHRPCFRDRLGLAGQPGLTDYLLGRAGPQEILQTVELSEPSRSNGVVGEAEHPAGGEAAGPPAGSPAGTLVCITAGSNASNPAELLIGDRFRDFLEKVTRAYDFVVFDSSPILSVVDSLELVPQVDAILLCVRARRTTRDQAQAARAALEKVPERPVGAVVTGMQRHGPDSADYYAY